MSKGMHENLRHDLEGVDLTREGVGTTRLTMP
jgi:hypothetical protein